MSLYQVIESREFWRFTDDKAVEFCGGEFEFEMNHLKIATPSAEATGDLLDEKKTPSRHLYGVDYPEVNRTLVSVLAMRWIMNNNYDAFAGGQSDSCRLSRRSWDDLREFFTELLVTPRDIQSLLVAIVVSDVGKDAKLYLDPHLPHHDPIEPDEKPNHDKNAFNCIVEESSFAAADSHLVPSLWLLKGDDKVDVRLGLELATQLNVAQLAQGENVPGSLTPLRILLHDHRRAFKLKMAEIILDVAGASGHRDTTCAAQMTEPTFQTYHTTISALTSLLDGNIATEIECYDQILRERAARLYKLGFRNLSPEVPKERVLLRLLSMGRVAEKGLANSFADALEDALNDGAEEIIPRLNASGLTSKDQAVLPYYAPALCANVLASAKEDKERLRGALAAFIRFLCRACDISHYVPREDHYVYEVDLSFAVKTVRSEEFRLDPRVLDNVRIPR